MSVQEMSSSSAAQPGPSPRAWLRLLGAWSLAIGLLIVAVWPVIATVTPETFATVINLSKRAKVQIKSAYPDIEASADGKYVAVVWSRGYDADPKVKEYGYIFLKSAVTGTNSTSDGWENQVKVFTPTDELWGGTKPRVVFDPNDSGKLYVTWVGCDVTKIPASPPYSSVSYQCDAIMAATCTLTGADQCSSQETVYTELHASPSLATPDIAVDKSGQPHVIWKNETTGTGAAQGIQYSRKSAGSWSAPVTVVGTDLSSYNPALVWGGGPSGNGRLHLIWYQYNDVAGSRYVRYSADDPGTGGWSNNPAARWSAPSIAQFTGGGTGQAYIKPSIAASGATVYAAWDAYKNSTSPEEFVLAYDWSTDSGTSWQDPGLGSHSGLCSTFDEGDGCGIPNAKEFGSNPTYESPWEYSQHETIAEERTLRPSIAISGAVPALAWHYMEHDIDVDYTAYVIVYQEGITDSGSITWTDPIIILDNINYDPSPPGTAYDDSADPDLALAPGSGVHIAHMGMWGGLRTNEASDWDIYYRGDIKTDNSTDGAGGVYLPIMLKNRQ
jgi:hypothetical protein